MLTEFTNRYAPFFKALDEAREIEELVLDDVQEEMAEHEAKHRMEEEYDGR